MFLPKILDRIMNFFAIDFIFRLIKVDFCGCWFFCLRYSFLFLKVVYAYYVIFEWVYKVGIGSFFEKWVILGRGVCSRRESVRKRGGLKEERAGFRVGLVLWKAVMSQCRTQLVRVVGQDLPIIPSIAMFTFQFFVVNSLFLEFSVYLE